MRLANLVINIIFFSGICPSYQRGIGKLTKNLYGAMDVETFVAFFKIIYSTVTGQMSTCMEALLT